MRPLLRVLAHVDMEHPIEMPTSVDEDVVQAFRADGPYEPLGGGVGPWRPDRGADDPYFFRPEYLVERTRELRVAVVQEEPDRGEPLGDAKAMISPARPSTGSGHQVGTESNPARSGDP